MRCYLGCWYHIYQARVGMIGVRFAYAEQQQQLAADEQDPLAD
ncbi:MAG: hypothetical protein ACTHKJ_02595 [Candidatus Nitrosocosmicus sp.]